MISTVLANMYGFVRLLMVLAVLVLLVLGWLLLRRGGRVGLGVLAGLSTAAALALTVTPDTATRSAQFCAVQARILTDGALDLPNMMLLLPATLFGVLWTRRPVAVLGAGIGLSALIELTQAILPLGRSCDTDDLISNSIGVVVGVLLALGLLAVHARRAPECRTASAHTDAEPLHGPPSS